MLAKTKGRPQAGNSFSCSGVYPRRSLTNLDDLVKTHRLVALGQKEDLGRARRVTRDDIMRNEMSFAPSRYLRKSVEAGPTAVPLEALARDEKAVELLELGIQRPAKPSWSPCRQVPLCSTSVHRAC